MGLSAKLIDLVVVGNVEIIDIFTGLLDGGFLLFARYFRATGEFGVSLFAPFSAKTRILALGLKKKTVEEEKTHFTGSDSSSGSL